MKGKTTNEQIQQKYEYLMNLTPDIRKRKTHLPYAVEVLDIKLVELEALKASVIKTASKDDINCMDDRLTSLKAAITCLIIGTI
tara:strand:- start:11392 stop:11643 length:252 start_codon:yes stop_codon:yes gene_type:complete